MSYDPGKQLIEYIGSLGYLPLIRRSELPMDFYKATGAGGTWYSKNGFFVGIYGNIRHFAYYKFIYNTPDCSISLDSFDDYQDIKDLIMAFSDRNLLPLAMGINKAGPLLERALLTH
jgi:hypothetical protein